MVSEESKKAIHIALERAVVKVNVGGFFKGTGFFVSPEYILTAHHCIGDYRSEIIVETVSYGDLRVHLDEEKSFRRSEIDIAVLRLYDPIDVTDYLPIGVLSKKHLGDEIVTLGYPQNTFNLILGKISGIYDDGRFINDAMKGEGQSGAPVYHYATNRVVGLALTVYGSNQMNNAGLAGRLDILLEHWPELEKLSQLAGQLWDKRFPPGKPPSKPSPPIFTYKKFSLTRRGLLAVILIAILSVSLIAYFGQLSQAEWVVELNTQGQIAYGRGDFSSAKDAYSELVRLNPTYENAWYNLGNALYKTNDFDAAEQAFDKQLKLTPNHGDAWNGLGQSLLEQENKLKSWLEQEENKLKSWLEQEEYELFKPSWEQENKLKLDNAVSALRKQLEINPKHEDAWYNLAQALDNQKKPGEAIAALRKQVAVKPDHKNAWNFLGNMLSAQEKTDEAIEAYRKQVEVVPYHESAWRNLGVMLSNKGKFEEAADAFKKQVEVTPNHKEAWNLLGVALWKQEKYDEAAATYRKQLEIKDVEDEPIVWLNLANALSAQGQHDEALQIVNQQIEKNPKSEQAYLHLGDILFEQEKYDEAIATYLKLIEINPTHDSAYRELGDIYLLKEKYDEAIAAYRKQLDIDKNNLNSLIGLGDIYQIQGNKTEAMTYLRKAETVVVKEIKTHPESPSLYNLLGAILMRQDRLAEAAEAFEKQLKITPTDKAVLHNDMKLALVQNDLQRFELRKTAFLAIVDKDDELSAIASFYTWLADPEADWQPVIQAIEQVSPHKQLGRFLVYTLLPAITRQSEQRQQQAQYFTDYFTRKIDKKTLREKLESQATVEVPASESQNNTVEKLPVQQ